LLPSAVATGRQRPLLSIDICCQHGAQQQTCHTLLLSRMMGQTDGRTSGQLTVS